MTEYSLADARASARDHGEALDALADSLSKPLLVPDAAGYDDARRVWNGAIDRYPVAIARPTGLEEIRAVLATARGTDLPVAVRSGGHSGPGFSTTDGGIVIDVSPMDEVLVDPEEGIARVGAGATWGDVDVATQRHGLATPGGIVSETGVVGLTLGGGTGWLTRAHGLASDRLRAVELLTIDGTHVRASSDVHPRLFAALQGGGGNFGVVTALEFDLVTLDHDVALLEAWYPLESLPDLLVAYRRRQQNAPNTVTVSPYVSTMPDDDGRRGVCMLGVSIEPPDADEYLDQFASLGSPIETSHERLPYVELQHRFDDDAVAGNRYYWKTIVVTDLTDDVIDAFVQRGTDMPGAMDTALVWPLGGAVSDVDRSETAFSHRNASFVLNFEAAWSDPADDDRERQWAAESVETIRDRGGDGVLPNFAGTERDEQTARAIFGEAYEWLRDVKTDWDPHDRLAPSGRLAPR